ncbi:MAG TPA: two-component sensor histidine kinase, partial [Bacteroidetes bacterium]|nr:two-component sensor histidine kinase [Bacteroidota bacterium]
MALLSKLVSASNRDKSTSELSLVPSRRYQRLWFFSILITSLVALIPLATMTVINYYQDQRAYCAEINFALSQILSNTKRTLELVIEERRSALSLIVIEHTYEDLISDNRLAGILSNLKNSFGDFVDLGLIDSEGNQSFYSGPYDLKGRKYKDQSWFHEVNLHRVYTSDVFMGYRGFPHFIIAIKHEKENGDFFVLRATIDMDLINRQIYSLDLDQSTDAFIINRDGILQTSSKFYGDVLDKCDIDLPFPSQNRVVIEAPEHTEKWITRGYTEIQGTPFILMTIKQQQNPLRHWISHRSSLLWFLGIITILILIVVVYRSTYMVNQLRNADQRRAKAFHNIEYTNKMATIGRMAGSVAHEINNPLAIINEKAGLLKDMVDFTEDFTQKEKVLTLVDSILNSVNRCSQVTHRLLGFAKRMDIRSELIDLERLMREVVGFMGNDAINRNISVNYDIPETIPHIESDRGLLQQIFLNIINNAFAAVEDGGRIDISVTEQSNDMV